MRNHCHLYKKEVSIPRVIDSILSQTNELQRRTILCNMHRRLASWALTREYHIGKSTKSEYRLHDTYVVVTEHRWQGGLLPTLSMLKPLVPLGADLCWTHIGLLEWPLKLKQVGILNQRGPSSRLTPS